MIEGERFEAALDDTPAARAVEAALPIESVIRMWGDEFYFEAGLGLDHDETSTTDVDVGDIAYWPEGDALCIFFGPTPASSGDRPVPAGPVNRVGRLIGDARALKKLSGSRKIVLSRNK